MSRSSRFVLSVLLVFVTVSPVGALAQDGKVPLTHDVYDDWRSIRGQALSDDGAWLLYAEVPQEGDAELVVRSLQGDAEYRHGLGWLTGGGGFGTRIDAQFTADSRHVVFFHSPAMADVKAARKAKKKPDQMPKKTLGLMALADGAVTAIQRVKSFAVPADSGEWLAYLKEEPLPADEPQNEAGDEPQAEATPEPESEPEAEESAEEKPAEKDKSYGTELVLRNLTTGAETSVDSALEYRFSDDGTVLLHSVSSEDAPETDGAYALYPADGSVRALATGEGNYKRLTVDDDSRRMAFISDVNDYAADKPVFELFGADVTGSGAADVWVSHSTTAALPDGFAVSDKEGIGFVANATAIVFGIKERPEPEEDEDAADDSDDEERAEFDLWHWDDPYPQPAQLLRADDVNDEAFESILWIDEGSFVQLADEQLPDVEVSDNGALAMGTSDRAWSKRASYEGFFNDVYTVDPRSGARTMVAERVSFGATMSPDGGFVAWFGGDGDWIGYDDNGGGGFAGGQDWFLYDAASGTSRNLTEGLDVGFERVDWDTPNLSASYGNAGFTEGDQGFLVYDQFDVWHFPTAGGDGPVRLTEGVGRERNTSFRIVRLDPDEDAVPAGRPIVLSSTNQETMATGFWVDVVGADEAPSLLLEADAFLIFRDLAADGTTFLFGRRTFAEFPDLWAGELLLDGDPNADNDQRYALADVRKVTDLGRQTEPYIWGNAELRDFYSADGVPLKGILVTPDDFDPDKQYPLMVYIYETLHQNLHFFRDPSPGTSINPSYYVSNGYVLWMPDIEYVTPGYPGRDAMKSVLPGINMLVNEGYIDADNIGIQGHSWGGYQIAYMVTQTDIFKAAESGAPVSNMTSAYGGIRWGSGLVRQFQYERTQSRLGASLWDVPLRYIENSPIFWADDINTPLLILHNDEDGAVPWYQGIELIMALRRLEKEAYMFNYNGEAHGLRQRVNQKDYTVRMQEFFDHHLRGAPAPEWMTKGIRGWEKGAVDR